MLFLVFHEAMEEGSKQMFFPPCKVLKLGSKYSLGKPELQLNHGEDFE
jgi:hypothetical protein